MSKNIKKITAFSLAICMLLSLGVCAGATSAATKTSSAVLQTPGVTLALSLGLDEGKEVVALSNGMDEKGRSMTFVLYADAVDVLGADTNPIYKENLGIAAISTSGKIVKLDDIIEGGYTPSMINISADGEGGLGAYLLVSAPTGGSGGTSTFKLLRYYGGEWSELLGDDFSLPIAGYLHNYYRATIRIPDANLYFNYGLSSEEKLTLTQSGNYESDGRLWKQDSEYFWTDGFTSMTPMVVGGEIIILAQETVYGGYHVNSIAQIAALYTLNENGTGLELYGARVYDMNEKMLATTK